MLISFVLRLVPDELARGRLVGHVEEVATGRQAPLRDVDELVDFCAGSGSVTLPDPRPADLGHAVTEQSDV